MERRREATSKNGKDTGIEIEKLENRVKARKKGRRR